MSETISVVRPAYALEEAYRMGHDEFSDLRGEETENFEFRYFTDTARWANHILPKLRAMAGYADTAGGTYTDERRIAAIHPGCEEDTPAEARLIDGHHLFRSLVDAYRTGAYDAVEDTYDPDSAQHHF